METTVITQIINGLVTQGGLALLAALIFYFYRQDRKDTINKLEELLESGEACRDKENDSRRELAKALNDFVVVLVGLKTIVEHQDKG